MPVSNFKLPTTLIGNEKFPSLNIAPQDIDKYHQDYLAAKGTSLTDTQAKSPSIWETIKGTAKAGGDLFFSGIKALGNTISDYSPFNSKIALENKEFLKQAGKIIGGSYGEGVGEKIGIINELGTKGAADILDTISLGLINDKYKDDTKYQASSHIADQVLNVGTQLATFPFMFSKIKGALGTIEMVPKIAATAQKYPILFDTLKTMGAFDVYGQLDPELGTDLKARAKRLGADTALGLVYESLGFIPKGKLLNRKLNVGMGDFGSVLASTGLGYTLEKMNGASNEDALIFGAGLGAVDLLSRANGKRNPFITNKAAEAIAKETALNNLKDLGIKVEENYSNADLDALRKRVSVNIQKEAQANKVYDFAGTPYEVKLKKLNGSLDYLKSIPEPQRMFYDEVREQASRAQALKEELATLFGKEAPKPQPKQEFSPTGELIEKPIESKDLVPTGGQVKVNDKIYNLPALADIAKEDPKVTVGKLDARIQTLEAQKKNTTDVRQRNDLDARLENLYSIKEKVNWQPRVIVETKESVPPFGKLTEEYDRIKKGIITEPPKSAEAVRARMNFEYVDIGLDGKMRPVTGKFSPEVFADQIKQVSPAVYTEITTGKAAPVIRQEIALEKADADQVNKYATNGFKQPIKQNNEVSGEVKQPIPGQQPIKQVAELEKEAINVLSKRTNISPKTIESYVVKHNLDARTLLDFRPKEIQSGILNDKIITAEKVEPVKPTEVKPEPKPEVKVEKSIEKKTPKTKFQKYISEEVTPLAEATFKVVDRLTNTVKRPTVLKSTIVSELNRPDIKKGEKQVIEDVLATFPEDQPIKLEDFYNKVKLYTLPMSIKGSDRYADYNNDEDRLNGDVEQTHIYQINVPTIDSSHFREEAPNYFAHTRVQINHNNTPSFDINEGIKTYTENISNNKIELKRFEDAEKFLDSEEFEKFNKKRNDIINQNQSLKTKQNKLEKTLRDLEDDIPGFSWQLHSSLQINDDLTISKSKTSTEIKKTISRIEGDIKDSQEQLIKKQEALKNIDNSDGEVVYRIQEIQSDLFQKKDISIEKQHRNLEFEIEEGERFKKRGETKLKDFTKALDFFENPSKYNFDLTDLSLGDMVAVENEVVDLLNNYPELNNMQFMSILRNTKSVKKAIERTKQEIDIANEEIETNSKRISNAQEQINYLNTPIGKTQYNQLVAYRNIWEERILREEFKLALDYINKNVPGAKLTFLLPNGKTIALIEGYVSRFDEGGAWSLNGSAIPEDKIEQGTEVEYMGEGWIILEQTEPGHFKAAKSDDILFNVPLSEAIDERIETRREDIKSEVEQLLKPSNQTFDNITVKKVEELLLRDNLDPLAKDAFKKIKKGLNPSEALDKVLEEYYTEDVIEEDFKDIYGDDKVYTDGTDIIVLKENAEIENGSSKQGGFNEDGSIDLKQLDSTQKTIYDRYEKTLPKVLKSLKKDFDIYTEDNNTEWYSVSIEPTDYNKPIYAYSKDNLNTYGKPTKQPSVSLEPGMAGEISEGAENISEGLRKLNSFLETVSRYNGEELNGAGTYRVSEKNPEEWNSKLKGFTKSLFKSVGLDLSQSTDYLSIEPKATFLEPFKLVRSVMDKLSSIQQIIPEYSKEQMMIDQVEVLRSAGYPEAVINRLNKFILSSPINVINKFDGFEFVSDELLEDNVLAAVGISSFDNNWSLLLPRTPAMINKPAFTSGRIIDHELAGHLIYTYARPEIRDLINYDVIEVINDKNAIKNIWTNDGKVGYSIKSYVINDFFPEIFGNVFNDLIKTNVTTREKMVDIFKDYLLLNNGEIFVSFVGKTEEQLISQMITIKTDIIEKLKANNLYDSLHSSTKEILNNNFNHLVNEVLARSLEYSTNPFDPDSTAGKYWSNTRDLSSKLFDNVRDNLDDSSNLLSILAKASEGTSDIASIEGETDQVSYTNRGRAIKSKIPVPREISDNLSSWQDRNALKLSRNNLDRNLEAVAGDNAQAVIDFFPAKVRENETARVMFLNSLRSDIRNYIVKELGIHKGSKEASLITKAAQDEITEVELARMTKYPEAVKKAANYFRSVYDDVLNIWNTERAKYKYAPVPKQIDYMPHLQVLTNTFKRFGQILKENDLPTEISGLTDMFKPGKPFTKSELSRAKDDLGFKYEEDALAAFDAYIDAVSKQIFHIDSVQRGRALENVIRESAKDNGKVAAIDRINLPNFVANLKEATNVIAGKKARFDRAFEDTFGRPFYSVVDFLRRRTSANMIAANISSALTNYIPLTQSLATTKKLYSLKGFAYSLLSPINSPEELGIISGTRSDFLTRRYPDNQIDMSGWEKIEKKAGWLFETIDRFVARGIVAGKYYENLAAGQNPKEAMTNADDYAARLIADRSVGQLPNLLSTRTLGLLTQFQTEVNNQFSFVFHDIPRISKGSKLRLLSMLAQIAIYSYIFNQLFEKLTGRRPAMDPIYTSLTLMGKTPEGEDKGYWKRLYIAGKDVLNNLPFTSAITGGRIPLSAGLPDVAGLLQGKASLLSESLKPAFLLAAPIGGLQMKKTFEGITAYNKGGVFTKTNQLQFPIEQTIDQLIKVGIFGKYSAPKAKLYYAKEEKPFSKQQTSLYNLLMSKGQTKQATKMYDQIMNIRAAKSKLNELNKKVLETGKAPSSKEVKDAIQYIKEYLSNPKIPTE